ncbi:hypothetical protein D1614_05060 [Maribellus luteus]|uniref:Lipoprotein n=1 Tax=Maribellus luteus TaxID=2305463 RepID=A0A399T7G0_9BACT|nr:hypothetical protein [Maribellus luteus]RIJ50117.1 hypothetical protein D1614_05060 [Maribellus luteus]
MKYIVTLSLAILLFACEKISYYELAINNTTEHEIRIEAFFKQNELEVINIPANDIYTRSVSKEKNEDIPIIFSTSLIDSVNIIFDSVKIIIQNCDQSVLEYCPDVYRNILRLYDEYEKEIKGKDSYYYTYTITEEDYNNAVPIE